ncbi:MAG: GNAT family N-acetyltransferase [Solirubrobacteraceae bacterium]
MLQRARATVHLRAARERDLPDIVRTLTLAFGEPLRGDTWQWILDSSEGAIFVAERRGEIVGTGAGLCFGATGWIGGLGVEPGSRRRGIASRLTGQVVDWLRDHGAETLLLQATGQGRPVYEQLGFVAEGAYRMWAVPPSRRPRRRDGPRGVRPLRASDLDAVLELDREVTGEDRTLALHGAWASGGYALDDGRLRGYHLHTPWGPGPTVAADQEAGLALIDTAQRPDESVRVGVPEANLPGVDAMTARGYEEVAGTQRMRLGPEVRWRPDLVFGVFNPFWG